MLVFYNNRIFFGNFKHRKKNLYLLIKINLDFKNFHKSLNF
ncbi:hypothetical protein RC23_01810 [Campylobacter jejuni]|nr:hypothetical protein RC23_01810 [Campylobacter jejuni]